VPTLIPIDEKTGKPDESKVSGFWKSVSPCESEAGLNLLTTDSPPHTECL
jgi:hypothetical protein